MKEVIKITNKIINKEEHNLLVHNLGYDGYKVKQHSFNKNTINTILER